MSGRRSQTLADVERRVLDAIDVEGMLDFLQSLIALPSLGGAETAAQREVAQHMERCGLGVDVWDIDFDALRAYPAYTPEIERTEGLGVVGTLGDASGRSLILNGHIDVVPAGELERWSVPPWQGTRTADRVYGRGSADMKGGLCCAIHAAKALRDAGVRLAGRVMIESVVGEEDGGAGTLAAIVRGYRADAAIVMEPTQLMVAPAQAGALNFRVTVPGVAAHGCLRHEGVSPIEKFHPIYDELMQLEEERNSGVTDPMFSDYAIPFALCVGTVRAGIWASTVAESLTCEGRLGVAVDEDPSAARAALEECVRRAAERDPWLRDHPPTVTWWGAQFAPARIPVDHAIVQTVSAAHETVTGASPTIRGMPFGADMRLLVREASTPTVLYGPGDVRRAHAPDEWVAIEELTTAVRTLAVTVVRFCGVA